MENILDMKKEVNLQNQKTKFCKHCGEIILIDAVLCVKCGRQVEELKQKESVVINNTNSNVSSNVNNTTRTHGIQKNKWVALALCIFLGYFGAHKFYEGKIGAGILYFFTGGLFFIGVVIDTIALLSKPNPYYVD